ncbi:hypothetical protein VNO77_27363 [Canavalia gladiata]|uniref:Uncharacterized protein n=1 Tax=Canavalia gladiata TaxID=3824 RepID=A0AAN9KV75_CANGL
MEKWNFQVAIIVMMKVYSFLHPRRLLIPPFLCCMLRLASIESIKQSQTMKLGNQFVPQTCLYSSKASDKQYLKARHSVIKNLLYEKAMSHDRNPPSALAEPLEIHNGIQLLHIVIPSSVQEASEESKYSFITSLDRLSNLQRTFICEHSCQIQCSVAEHLTIFDWNLIFLGRLSQIPISVLFSSSTIFANAGISSSNAATVGLLAFYLEGITFQRILVYTPFLEYLLLGSWLMLIGYYPIGHGPIPLLTASEMLQEVPPLRVRFSFSSTIPFLLGPPCDLQCDGNLLLSFWSLIRVQYPFNLTIQHLCLFSTLLLLVLSISLSRAFLSINLW